MRRGAPLSPARRKRVAQRFAEAMEFQRAGRPAEAERGLVLVLERDPEHAPALHALGLMRHRRGQREEALELMQRGAGGHDADASLFNNLGGMLVEAGRPREAMQAYRRALALEPANVNACFNLGGLLMAEGDAPGAEACYRRVLDTAPGDAVVRIGLARALLARGQADEALTHLREAMALAPDDPGCPVVLSQALLAADRVEEAVEVARDAERRWPQDAGVLHALAKACITWEDYEGAEEVLGRILASWPDDAIAWEAMARALLGQWRNDDALALCRRFVERFPGAAASHGVQGIALKQAGHLHEAVAAFRCALDRDPAYAAAWSNLGQTWMDLGDMAQAEDCFRRALDLEPDLVEAYYNLTRMRRSGPQDVAQAATMEALAASAGLTLTERVSLHFALGKVFDDLGEYDRAFHHYERGNAQKRRSVHFLPDRFEAWMQGFHETFTAEFFRRCQGFGNDSRRPVFIVGVPRSGTSLVEQILASHPQVHGAGELPTLSALADSIAERLGASVPYPRAAASLDAATAGELGEAYLASIAELDATSARVTDKMPSNYVHLGLIAVTLPGARIIHCRRDPMDACFSNFIQLFADAHFYSYSLEHIAVYFHEYERIMAHWREVLPLPVHEVHYEALVDDPQGQTRAMLEHLDLPWDDACLSFYRTRRAVRTASHWQVRQPIYRSARQRWRRYEAHLRDLAERIGYRDPATG